MRLSIPKKEFLFLRHALTDHNVHQIYNDENEIELNQKGIEQALKMQKTLAFLPVTTVCSSPLRRAQQTKEIVLKNKAYNDVILDELKECPSRLWRLFIALETRPLSTAEWESIQEFIDRVERGLHQALQFEKPLLIIAHGGTYWAISHLLKLDGIKKIDNCLLAHIGIENDVWKVNLSPKVCQNFT